ncbi:hypothetical protein IJ596_03325, partial [bacterium]|nr:hypothetical protein [bacterium]
MLIQQIQYNNIQPYRKFGVVAKTVQNKTAPVRFCGEMEEDLIQKIGDLENPDKIKDLLEEYNIATFGRVTTTRLTEFLKEVFKIEQKVKNKQTRIDAKLKSISTYTARENNNIAGAARVLNGINDEEIETYDNLGEQISVVRDVLERYSAKVTRPSVSTIKDLVYTMQNNEGIISSEMVDFIRYIIDSRKIIQSHKLKNIVSVMKDDNGNLSQEKLAAFYAHEWNYSPLDLNVEFVKKYGSAENTPNIYDKKFIEQVRTIAKILNEKVTTDGLHNNLKYLRNAGLLNLGDLVCALRDNNGEIADTTIESIKKIISKAKNVGELPQYLSCLKDKDGNIDPKKANAFYNYYLYDDSLEATSDFIIKAFSDNQQVNYVDEIIKVRSALYNSDSDLENLSPTTYQDIIFAMVNKKGEIPEETIEFLKNLLDMKK